MILRNAIKTPDGTILVSRHRHDYQTHFDTVANEEYMVDGGLDYVRRTVNTIPAEDLTVTMSDSHVKRRNAFEWGTYGPNGDQALGYIKLKDMDSDHITACLAMPSLRPDLRKLFKSELVYRTWP